MRTIDYDHGLIYIVKGTIQRFNLHSTAKLTEETKARHSGAHGYLCGIEVSLELEPLSASVSNGIFGITDDFALEQVLKVTGHKKQSGDEFALVEWFYSGRQPEIGETPCQIHKIRFVVLDNVEEKVVEDGELRLQLAEGHITPESVGNTRTFGNQEQVFYRLAFKLIDITGDMLLDFELALRQSIGGRIDWSIISALQNNPSPLAPKQRVSYFEANNKIFYKIRELFLNGLVTYTHINDLLHAVDNVIMKREEEFERFARHSSFDRKSHQHVIGFWKNNRKLLVNLLHYIDIQSEIRKNESDIIRDDLAIGITDTDFTHQSTLKQYAEDFIARLIIPAFFLIILWFFWAR